MITIKYKNLSAEREQAQGDLWYWFLTNLSAGQFENITNDGCKCRLLSKFFEDSAFGTARTKYILLLPTQKLNKSPSFLLDLVCKFYSDQDELRHDISITPVGSIASLEATIVLVCEEMHEDDYSGGFEEEKRDQGIDVDSYISGEEGYVASPAKSNEISSVISGFNGISFADSQVSSSETDQGIAISVETLDSPTSLSSSISSDLLLESVLSSNKVFDEPLSHFPTKISSITLEEDEYHNNDSLILKSMLCKDCDTGELKTAIRQMAPIGSEEGQEKEDWLLYDSKFSLDNLELLSFEDIMASSFNDSKILFYALETNENSKNDSLPTSLDDNRNEMREDTDLSDLDNESDSDNESDLRVMEFQGNGTYNTDCSTPMLLTKTNTLNTFKSIRSEFLVHNPDGTYSNISKSKSEPLNFDNRIRKLQSNRKHSVKNTSCVVM